MPCMEVTRTQEKILQAAKTLMLSKGYPATTVDEICANAKISKGSFYHAFSSKEELGLSLLEWYHQGGAEKIFGGSFNDLEDSTQKMFAFLDHVDRSSKELWSHGCLLGSLGTELAETNPKIRAKVSSRFNKLTLRLEEILEPAAKRNTAHGGPSAKELAEQFLVMLEGSLVLARVNKDWSVVKRGFKNFRAHLHSLSR
jgi:TetR/AcrR family transcriptional repressor of nem operon